jgi:hypothetical protein
MRPPDLAGPLARAWDVIGRKDELARDDLQQQAALAAWFLHAPAAHPCWQWYALSVVRLSDVPGYPPALRRYPAAQYELLVAAISPEDSQDFDPGTARVYRMLTPFDHVIQFHGVTEGQAARVAAELAGRVTMGLSPDQDFRPVWCRLVDDLLASMRKEA